MKIAYIVSNYNKRGGIERCTAELCERLCHDNEIHVYTRNFESKQNLPIKFHKIRVSKLPSILDCFSYFLFMIKATKEAKKGDFDIIHGGLEPDIITAHSCHRAWVEFKKRNGEFLRYLFNPAHHIILFLENRVYKQNKFKKIIAVSTGVKEELIKYYNIPESKIEVVPNGVDLSRFKKDTQKRKEIREKFGFLNNDFVLLFVGNEFRRKGLQFIIKALPEIEDKKVKLLVVGGANKKPYEKLAEKLGVFDRVLFVGKQKNTSDYYSATDIFVFPTLYEPFGLVILEAMASSLPVITSKCAGIIENFTDDLKKYLLDNPRDSYELANKLNLLMQNPQEVEKLGNTSRKFSEEYSWNKNAERITNIYREIEKSKRK